MNKMLIKSFLSLISLILSLILCEFITSALGYGSKTTNSDWINGFLLNGRERVLPYTTDVNLIYRNNPNLHRNLGENDTRGFRNDPNHTKNPKGKIILIVGDSFTYGVNVPFNQSYPYYMEQMLDENGISATVYNAGVPGYGPDQEFIYIRDYLLPIYHPDMLIWNFYNNDIYDANEACLFKKDNLGIYRQISAWHNTLFWRGALVQNAPTWLIRSALFNFITYIPSMIAHRERYTFGCTLPDTNWGLQNETELNKIAYFISQIKLLTNKSKTVFILVLSPTQAYFSNQNSTEALLNQMINNVLNASGVNSFDANTLISNLFKPATQMNQEGSDTKLGLVSSRPNILGVSSNNLYNSIFLNDDEKKYWHHLNSQGNYFYAKVITEKVIKMIKTMSTTEHK